MASSVMSFLATTTPPTTVPPPPSPNHPSHEPNSPPAVDPGHPVYNAIPGRYVNRIGNGTFTLDNVTYHLEKNDGNNTLHSGTNNWSYHFWNLTALTKDSITFEYHDAAFAEGMPGRVDASVTYKLTKNTWHISMSAESPDVRTREFPRPNKNKNNVVLTPPQHSC